MLYMPLVTASPMAEKKKMTPEIFCVHNTCIKCPGIFLRLATVAASQSSRILKSLIYVLLERINIIFENWSPRR
jgi:hypothetical protein